MKKSQGFSMIVVIITIVVVIILSSIVMQTSSDVPDKAHYTEYMQEMKNVQTGVENQKILNARKGTSVDRLTKGFKKVYLDNVPASFVSFGDIDEDITGYLVSLEEIDYEGSKFGNDYQKYFDLTENDIPKLKFGDKDNDVYVIDAEWTVYYVKGLPYDGSMNYTFQ